MAATPHTFDFSEAPPTVYGSASELQDSHGVMPYEALKLIPDIEWLLQGVIPEGSEVMVAADAGSGKTYMLLELALFVASGMTDWHGKALRPQEGRVLYFVTEGRRQPRQIDEALTIKYPDRPMPEDFFFHSGVTLPEDVGTLRAILSENPYQLVVLDTLMNTFSGDSDNDSKDTANYFGAVREVVREHEIKWGFRPTVIYVHHASRSSSGSKPRGSTNLEGSMDTLMVMTLKEETMVTTVKCMKMKEDERFSPFEWWLEAFDTGRTNKQGDAVAVRCIRDINWGEPGSQPLATAVDDRWEQQVRHVRMFLSKEPDASKSAVLRYLKGEGMGLHWDRMDELLEAASI